MPRGVSLATKPKAGDSHFWAIAQRGAFASKANVAKLLADLESGGFRSYIVPLERNGRVLDAVRVGPVDTIDEARQLAARLKGDGHSAAVVRNDL